ITKVGALVTTIDDIYDEYGSLDELKVFTKAIKSHKGYQEDETERGKTANSITCYMHDTGLSEEVARGYIKVLIDEAWRKLIKARVDCSQESADPIIDMAINLARISTCTYQITNTGMDMELLILDTRSESCPRLLTLLK
ncbi:(E)-beta-ocimene synthase, chloroplastic-like protein, partial [Tanacetum coccineum]